MNSFKVIMALSGILNFFMPVSMAIDPNCDFYQELIMGQEYYVYNQKYPQNYGASTSCKWVAKSQAGTRIIISCEDITIPSSQNCNGDRLSISLTGNEKFADARNYCGTGTLSLVSQANSLAIGLFSTARTEGGKFMCTVTSILDPEVTTPSPPVQPGCDCGWKQGTRIVGGMETLVNEFPLMAGIVDSDRKELYCGASIISDRYLLTAAHCLLKRKLESLGVLVGDHNINQGNDTKAAALYKLLAFEIHPNFDVDSQVNDLAILKTSTTIKFSLYVGPACLPFLYTANNLYGYTVTALGWGQTEFSGPKSDTLQKVDLQVISNEECASQHTDKPITAQQVCTYAPEKDACQSDSGGPLLWMDSSKSRLHLVGVISYGLGCATQKAGVNTRVTSYLPWIISRTTDANYCIK